MEKSEYNYIKDWRTITQNQETKLITLKNVKLKIPYGVFNPSEKITFSTSFLLNNLPFDLSNKRVLDMGTGSGIIGIKSEINKAKSILAVDVHKKSLAAAIENAQINKCENITFVWSDLFSNVLGGKFDYIFANLPILEVDFDELYLKLLNYYENFLSENGELWIVFASFGDMNRAHKAFIKHPNCKHDDIQSVEKFGVKWFIYKFTK